VLNQQAHITLNSPFTSPSCLGSGWRGGLAIAQTALLI